MHQAGKQFLELTISQRGKENEEGGGWMVGWMVGESQTNILIEGERLPT